MNLNSSKDRLPKSKCIRIAGFSAKQLVCESFIYGRQKDSKPLIGSDHYFANRSVYSEKSDSLVLHKKLVFYMSLVKTSNKFLAKTPEVYERAQNRDQTCTQNT